MTLAQYTRSQVCIHISFRSQIQLFHYLLNEYWLCLLNLNVTIFTDHIKIANPKIIFAYICLCIHLLVFSHLTLNHWLNSGTWNSLTNFFSIFFFFFLLGLIKVVFIRVFSLFSIWIYLFHNSIYFSFANFQENFQHGDNLDSVFVC